MSSPWADPLVLPRGSRPDLAYVETEVVPGPFVATRILYTPPGDYAIVPQSIVFGFTTSAVAGNREIILIVLRADGSEVTRMPAFGVQGPSIAYSYAWQASSNAAYFNGQGNYAMPLPRIAIPPTWKIGVQVNNLGAGDSGTMLMLNSRVPTGPREESEPEIPTPLVL